MTDYIDCSRGLHYLFVHKGLPKLVLDLTRTVTFYQWMSRKRGEFFLNFKWEGLAESAGFMKPEDKLTLSKKTLFDHYEIFVIHMPRPRHPQEAFFAAAVYKTKKRWFRKEIHGIRLFTLESGRDTFDHIENYHFCEWTDDGDGATHINYGQIPDAAEVTFIKKIGEVLQEKSNPDQDVKSSREKPGDI